MAYKNKNLEIREYFKKAILNGDFAFGRQIPTDSEIAEEFGVSRPTVAKALGYLSEMGLVERKVGAGTFVTWKPEIEGGRTLGMIVPALGETEIFEPICAKIGELACGYDFNLMWGQVTGGDEDKALHAGKLADRYVRQGVDGVILAPLELVPGFEEINRDIAAELHDAGIHIVLLDTDIEVFPDRSVFDVVGLNNLSAGYIVTGHLLDRGCTRVVFFSRHRSAATVTVRRQGYRDALEDRAIDARDRLIITGDPEDGARVARMLEELKPDAVLCGNDATAAQLMRTLGDAGIDVPGTLNIAGFDDVRYASLLSPSLTTIHQPCEMLAAVALNTMKSRLEHPTLAARTVSLEGELIVRESTGGTAG